MWYKSMACVTQILPMVERIICRVFIWMVRVKCSNINRPWDTFNCNEIRAAVTNGEQRGQRLIFSQTTDRLTVVMVSDVPCPPKFGVWEKRRPNKGVHWHVWIKNCVVGRARMVLLHWIIYVHIIYFQREIKKIGPSDQETWCLFAHEETMFSFRPFKSEGWKNRKLGEICTSVPQLFKCFPDCLCNTFRKGMTKGRSGKLVASCSLEWNSSIVKVEFCRERGKKTWIHVENIMWWYYLLEAKLYPAEDWTI